MKNTITARSCMLALAIAAMGIAGCKSNNESANRSQADYTRSLDDSIAVITQEIDSCNSAIGTLRNQTDVWLRDFVTVDNPREAGPYIIFHSFRNQYPPKGTGLIARLADNGQFELIASLKGTRFNQITVSGPTPSATASSEVVPYDQALNYMADGLNTVLFTGPKADSIGHLISDNQLNDIKVIYIDNRQVGSWKMPVDTRKMIMASYQLYAGQKETNRLERRIPMLSRKIEILRMHKEKSAAQTDIAK